MEDRPIETFERCNIAEQERPEGKEENEISLPSFPFLSFRSMTESNGRIIIICADLKYRKRIGIQRSRLYGMVKERIRKIPAKYARSSVARVEDRWSGIGMRSALSRNKGMLSARTGIGDENKNALEIYTCMCGRKRIRFEDRQKETKRRTRWISQKDPYIYIYISNLFRESRDELTSYRFPRYTIQQKTRCLVCTSPPYAEDPFSPVWNLFRFRPGRLRPSRPTT